MSWDTFRGLPASHTPDAAKCSKGRSQPEKLDPPLLHSRLFLLAIAISGMWCHNGGATDHLVRQCPGEVRALRGRRAIGNRRVCALGRVRVKRAVGFLHAFHSQSFLTLIAPPPHSPLRRYGVITSSCCGLQTLRPGPFECLIFVFLAHIKGTAGETWSFFTEPFMKSTTRVPGTAVVTTVGSKGAPHKFDGLCTSATLKWRWGRRGSRPHPDAPRISNRHPNKYFDRVRIGGKGLDGGFRGCLKWCRRMVSCCRHGRRTRPPHALPQLWSP